MLLHPRIEVELVYRVVYIVSERMINMRVYALAHNCALLMSARTVRTFTSYLDRSANARGV